MSTWKNHATSLEKWPLKADFSHLEIFPGQNILSLKEYQVTLQDLIQVLPSMALQGHFWKACAALTAQFWAERPPRPSTQRHGATMWEEGKARASWHCA